MCYPQRQMNETMQTKLSIRTLDRRMQVKSKLNKLSEKNTQNEENLMTAFTRVRSL